MRKDGTVPQKRSASNRSLADMGDDSEASAEVRTGRVHSSEQDGPGLAIESRPSKA